MTTSFKNNHFYSKLAYILLTVGVVFGLYFQQKSFEKELRHAVHQESIDKCIVSIEVVNKFNDLVYSLIETREESKANAILAKDKALIKVNKDAIARYKSQIIAPETQKDCQRIGE